MISPEPSNYHVLSRQEDYRKVSINYCFGRSSCVSLCKYIRQNPKGKKQNRNKKSEKNAAP